jgi:hypothetical protein
MKILLLVICLMTLAACSGEKSAKENPPEFNPSREEIRRCGYEDSRIRALCMPIADYYIISHRPLPAKIKILMTIAGRKYEHSNECDPRGDVTVTRSVDSGLIFFEAIRRKFYRVTELEIVDMGANCDNNAIFFLGTVEPKIEIIPNDRDRATWDLEN